MAGGMRAEAFSAERPYAACGRASRHGRPDYFAAFKRRLPSRSLPRFLLSRRAVMRFGFDAALLATPASATRLLHFDVLLRRVIADGQRMAA